MVSGSFFLNLHYYFSIFTIFWNFKLHSLQVWLSGTISRKTETTAKFADKKMRVLVLRGPFPTTIHNKPFNSNTIRNETKSLPVWPEPSPHSLTCIDVGHRLRLVKLGLQIFRQKSSISSDQVGSENPGQHHANIHCVLQKFSQLWRQACKQKEYSTFQCIK